VTGIAQLFAELSGDEPDWFQMQFWFERQYEIKKEQCRDANRFRRALNRAAERAMARAAKAAKLERRECVRCKQDAVSGKTMCQRHLDWERDYKARMRARRAA
jgi:hypothetical protein